MKKLLLIMGAILAQFSLNAEQPVDGGASARRIEQACHRLSEKINLQNYRQLKMCLYQMHAFEYFDAAVCGNYKQIEKALEIPFLFSEERELFLQALKEQLSLFEKTVSQEQLRQVMKCKPINIAGIDKAALLRVLFAAALPKAMGYAYYDPEQTLSDKDIWYILKKCEGNVGYAHGRAMKLYGVLDNELYVETYNKYNGHGMAEKVLQPLLAQRDRAVQLRQARYLKILGFFRRISHA